MSSEAATIPQNKAFITKGRSASGRFCFAFRLMFFFDVVCILDFFLFLQQIVHGRMNKGH